MIFGVEVDLSNDLSRFALPEGVQRRLQSGLDKQEQGNDELSDDERLEAEGLVELVDML